MKAIVASISVNKDLRPNHHKDIILERITRNSDHPRPKECYFSDPVSCVFLLHMGLFITNLLIL